MSERVVFGVFADRDQWVVSVQNRIFYEEDGSKALMAAGELAETLNAREEELEKLRDYCGNELARSDFRTATEMRAELERLKAENAAQAAKIGRLRELLSLVMPDEMGGTPDLFGPQGGWEKFEADVQAALADKEPK